MRPVLACLLLATACSNAAAGIFQPSGTGEPVVPSPDQRAAVVAAYLDFHRAFQTALGGNDATGLPAVTAEPLTSRLTEVVRSQERRSVVRRTHTAVNPRIAWIKGGTAHIVDCVSSPGFTTFDAGSGKRRGPAARPEQAVLNTRLVLDGTWKVASIRAGGPC
ncbi:hypothetical protein EDD29_0375 [Actinocorallia herbida]|uniref:Mce-associated membrane protein n=1 Tax=Actinocorallia herbida TaxID=58109 RepID=A0A3N1CNJ7_9ACTN|nr:hypothetical protein [Actinocorallia herbida]ROO82890.1 hypothetical protein EDD29_0375 [Actinocorallia herbida]